MTNAPTPIAPCPVNDRMLTWLCRHLDGIDPAQQHEIEVTTRELIADRRGVAKAIEVASIAALSIRLRGRRAAGQPAAAWLQGALLGGVILLGVVAVETWAEALGSGAEASTRLAAVLAALCVSCGAAVARRGMPLRGAALASAGIVPHLVELHGGDRFFAAFSAAAVGVLALLLGSPSPRRSRHGSVAFDTALVIGIFGAAAVLGSLHAVGVASVVATGVLPALLVGLAVLDPRFGAAAVVLWGWRFIASEPGGLGRALAGLTDDQDPLVLMTRWLVMAIGVFIAIAVTHRAVRRSLLL